MSLSQHLSLSLSISLSCFGMNVFNNKSQFSPLARGRDSSGHKRGREAAVYLKRAIRVISLCGSFTIFGHWAFMDGEGREGGLGWAKPILSMGRQASKQARPAQRGSELPLGAKWNGHNHWHNQPTCPCVPPLFLSASLSSWYLSIYRPCVCAAF